MKLADHVINYLANGLQLPEMAKGQRSAKEFRKFRIADDLFYFVHDTGYVVVGRTLMTALKPRRDILKDIAKWETLTKPIGGHNENNL